MQSMAGSAACLGGGFVAGALSLWYLQSSQVMGQLPPDSLLLGSLLVACIGAAVESLPIPEIDNITVPVAVVLVSSWYFAG
jgi:dolichol kinase